jgi:pyruvate kinase
MWKNFAQPIKNFLAGDPVTPPTVAPDSIQTAIPTSPPATTTAPTIYTSIDQKKTKIVATIGPATDSEEQIRLLIQSGMNVARFNTKHNEPKWHIDVIARVRKIAKEMQVPVAILLDIQGPEVRIHLLDRQSFDVKKGESVTFISDKAPQNSSAVVIPQEVVTALNVGNTIILDDGTCELVITKKDEHGFDAQAVDACTIKTQKTMNTPHVTLDMPALLPTDLVYLDAMRGMKLEFVALSFVRTQGDISNLKNELQKRDIHADVIAKIENQKSLDNLDSIISISDAIMVARGDLGVEVPFEEMTFWQKKIIHACQQVGKPVITATQMLTSMTEHPTPTRAEVSDVANAVYDGTDAVMLSEETTTGKYPVKSVQVQAKIVAFYEKKTAIFPAPTEPANPTTTLAEETKKLVEEKQNAVQKIVVVCDDCALVHQLARYRLPTPVVVVTSNLFLASQFCLSYGVVPFCVENAQFENLSVNECMNLLKEKQKLSLGEKIIFIYTFSQQKENASQPLIREVV